MNDDASGTTARRPSLLSPLFLVSAALLSAAAVGLHPAIGALIGYYSKAPIELRRSLDDLDPTKLRSFRLARPGHGMEMGPGDVETDDVIHPVFEPVDPAWPRKKRDEVMLFVTYYSNPRDRIAHTPEVCYRQSGAVIRSMATITLDIPTEDGPTTRGRLLDIERGGEVRTVLAYVFCSNGRLYHDREAVRMAIGWPGDTHTYFSKVEAISTCLGDADFDAAVARCRRMLEEVVPALMTEHFPPNEDVRRR